MAENHDDDDDIVKPPPIAGKGKKKPRKPPPKLQFTPLETFQGERLRHIPDIVDPLSPSALFTYILPDTVIQDIYKVTNTAAREAFQAKGDRS